VIAGGNLKLEWTGDTGFNYQIEYGADLVHWTPVGAATPGTGALMNWSDDGSQTGSAPSAETRRFYRLRISN
jgi:hypothetical protein